MEALIHNLNTMHSRAGAQTPFSSLNYGTDTSPEGRMVIKNMLLADARRALDTARPPSSPSTSSRSRRGSTTTPATRTTTCSSWPARSAPSGCSRTSPFWTRRLTCNTIKPGHPETEVAYMGCRTRVVANVYDPSREITTGRGNLSFTSINLPRLGILANKDIDLFFELLDQRIDLVIRAAARALPRSRARRRCAISPS